jgi:hypothetical protein
MIDAAARRGGPYGAVVIVDVAGIKMPFTARVPFLDDWGASWSQRARQNRRQWR